ncbi:hypothetical protein [Virgibacillus chiguensis]|nr:hypothetical protein [Virgibacillus chiguensis]
MLQCTYKVNLQSGMIFFHPPLIVYKFDLASNGYGKAAILPIP